MIHLYNMLFVTNNLVHIACTGTLTDNHQHKRNKTHRNAINYRSEVSCNLIGVYCVFTKA